ncbi:HEAT repeat domain-containing protein [Treponema sp. R80B11-R83G3]
MNKKVFIIFLFVFSASLIYGDLQDEEIVDVSEVKDPSSLWKLFLDNPDSTTGVDILIKLGTLGKGNKSIIDNLNSYLMGKTLLFKSGESVNYTLVSACISAIMDLGDSSSYPALFSVFYVGYPEVIASEAQGALEVIPGNLYQFLVNVIYYNSPEEKFAAFRIGANSDKLNVPQQGQIAELALEQGLNADDENIDMAIMRYSAVLLLTQLRWTRANALAIKHYYRVQTDYLQNAVPKERYIEAIACLGAVGNSDATSILGLQLGLINARMERTGSFDAEITLAVVQALGNIGFNAAFDQLLYVGNLSYPEEIQAAAREAIDRLKW